MQHAKPADYENFELWKTRMTVIYDMCHVTYEMQQNVTRQCGRIDVAAMKSICTYHMQTLFELALPKTALAEWRLAGSMAKDAAIVEFTLGARTVFQQQRVQNVEMHRCQRPSTSRFRFKLLMPFWVIRLDIIELSAQLFRECPISRPLFLHKNTPGC